MPSPDEVDAPDTAGSDRSAPSGPSYAFGVSLLTVGAFFILFAARIEELGFADENDPGPRAFPLMLSAVLLVGGGWELASQWWRTRELDVSLLFGLLLIYLFTVPFLGFYIATFALASVVMGLLKARWWVCLLAASGLLVVVQVLFVRLFKVQLPPGMIRDWWEGLKVSSAFLQDSFY